MTTTLSPRRRLVVPVSGKVANGRHYPEAVIEIVVWEVDWFCTDYTAAGLVLSDEVATRVEALARESSSDTDQDHDLQSGEVDAEQRAAAQAEAHRRERRKVIAFNKLREAAQQVRRQFITDNILARLVDCCRRVSIGVGPAV